MKIELITGRVIEVVEDFKSLDDLFNLPNAENLIAIFNYKDTVIQKGEFVEVSKPIRINLKHIVSYE